MLGAAGVQLLLRSTSIKPDVSCVRQPAPEVRQGSKLRSKQQMRDVENAAQVLSAARSSTCSNTGPGLNPSPFIICFPLPTAESATAFFTSCQAENRCWKPTEGFPAICRPAFLLAPLLFIELLAENCFAAVFLWSCGSLNVTGLFCCVLTTQQ